MESVREQLLRRFPVPAQTSEPDADVAYAVYSMLWSLQGVIVDGWTLFRVIRESVDSLDAVGLMMLLPSGSVPMSVSIRTEEGVLAWSALVGVQDERWLALPDSKRWNHVYLYATGDRSAPWSWAPACKGVVRCADG